MKAPRDDIVRAVHEALDGVGDASLGEWGEWLTAYHLKRRLSHAECIQHELSMIDLRDTPQGRRMMRQLVRDVPMIKDLALKIGELEVLL